MLTAAACGVVTCNRSETSELFRLAAGGYGLFGIVTSVTLRLVPRQEIKRVVELRDTAGFAAAFERRIRDGFLYGVHQHSRAR